MQNTIIDDGRIKVPTELLPEIQKEIAAMTKRAGKHGVPAPVLSIIGDTEPFEIWDDDLRRWLIYPATAIEITVPELIIPGGWQFLAVIRNEAGAIIVDTPRHVVDAHLPSELWTEAGLRCDHCKRKSYRVRSYYLESEDGRSIVVGSTCAKDYFGVDIELLLSKQTLNLLYPRELKERDYGFGNLVPSWELKEVLAAAHKAIAYFGWVSGNTAYNEACKSTKEEVFDLLWGRKEQQAAILASSVKYSPISSEEIERMIAWAKNDVGDSDYGRNVSAIAQAGCVGPKSMGTAVSIVSSYNRHIEKVAQATARESVGPSTFLDGEPKGRVTFQARVTSTDIYANDFGNSYVARMITPTGQRVTWSASRDHGFSKGDEFTAQATIKSKAEDKYGPVTKVLRLKVLSEITHP